MIDKDAIKAENRRKAEAIKAKAKQKAASAREDVKVLKALEKNPPPEYFEEPEYTGDPEKDAALDLDAVQAAFRKRAKDERRRFALAVDSEYWACFCFHTREQKEAFLSALNLLGGGDKHIDGVRAAEILGIKLPPSEVLYNTSSRIDKKLAELALPDHE